jgi:hypothetical protein
VVIRIVANDSQQVGVREPRGERSAQRGGEGVHRELADVEKCNRRLRWAAAACAFA